MNQPATNQPKSAVVLLSGGLDSATTLSMAKDQGFECHALAVDYGQRHSAELQAARRVAESCSAASFRVVKMDLRAIGGSALTDDIGVPDADIGAGIPVTYVPARNTVLLSVALGLAEVVKAEAIFIGVNAMDYSGYPDCRPEFIQSFQQLARLATKTGVEGARISIRTPLIALSKAEIIQTGMQLGVDYSETVSCYKADSQGRACGRCDSCVLRSAGFKEAGLADPTRYKDDGPHQSF